MIPRATDFKGKCPFCGSSRIEVEDATNPEWGNNDQAVIDEEWSCHNCRRSFGTRGLVEVTSRSLILNVNCPYCKSSAMLEAHGDVNGLEWYDCENCRRDFFVRPESYYQKEESQ